MVKNEQTDHRFHQKLPRLPTKQGLPSLTIRAVFPAGVTICTMAIYSNGFHHGATHLRGMPPAMGGYQPIHQDGALHPAPGKNRSGPSGHLWPRSMETPRVAHRHCVGQRLSVHIGSMEGVHTALWYTTPYVHGISPANEQTNGASQQDD